MISHFYKATIFSFALCFQFVAFAQQNTRQNMINTISETFDEDIKLAQTIRTQAQKDGSFYKNVGLGLLATDGISLPLALYYFHNMGVHAQVDPNLIASEMSRFFDLDHVRPLISNPQQSGWQSTHLRGQVHRTFEAEAFEQNTYRYKAYFRKVRDANAPQTPRRCDLVYSFNLNHKPTTNQKPHWMTVNKSYVFVKGKWEFEMGHTGTDIAVGGLEISNGDKIYRHKDMFWSSIEDLEIKIRNLISKKEIVLPAEYSKVVTNMGRLLQPWAAEQMALRTSTVVTDNLLSRYATTIFKGITRNPGTKAWAMTALAGAVTIGVGSFLAFDAADRMDEVGALLIDLQRGCGSESTVAKGCVSRLLGSDPIASKTKTQTLKSVLELIHTLQNQTNFGN